MTLTVDPQRRPDKTVAEYLDSIDRIVCASNGDIGKILVDTTGPYRGLLEIVMDRFGNMVEEKPRIHPRRVFGR